MDEFITKENKEALEKELLFLTTTKRKEIVSAVQYAKSLGDLSENAEYHAAREEQGKMEGRIAFIEQILKTAKVIDRKSDGTVDIGSSVVIKKEGENNTRNFTIVGSEETDMLSGKISYKSPIGKALMGKKVGENTTVSTPKGDVVYNIVSVN
jgi:transcription elongation factor GreA